MMQALRNKMKYILGVVALAFLITLIFSWGMGGFKDKGPQRGIVGTIAGQKIQYQQFQNALSQEVANAREQAGENELSDYQIRSLRDRVWESMIQEILFSKEIARLGITASAEEVVFQLRNNPPAFLQSNEEFQTDGNFDYAKYQQALTNPQNYNAWVPVENYLHRSIPLQKLQQRVLSTVRVTDAEVLDDYIKENEKVNAEYIFIDPNDVSLENIQVSLAEIKSYYKTNKENYLEQEKRQIEYVRFENKPSREDTLQTLYDMEDIHNLIKKGDDFAETAKEFSEDEGTAEKGGDLGFFDKNTMVTPFTEAAFNAKVGAVVGPVETPFGIHLIKVIARKREKSEIKVHARHILLKYKTSSETIDNIQNRCDYLYDEIMRNKGKYFREVIEEEGFTVEETPLFVNGSFIPGIGPARRISQFAFQEKRGWVSQTMYAGENLHLFRIIDIEKAHTKPLTDVKEEIQSILEREKQKENAGKICQNLYKQINSGASFYEVSARDSIEIKETGLFNIQSSVPQIGMDVKFIGTAFKLNPNEMSEPIEGDRGFYLLKVKEHTKVSMTLFETDKDSRKNTLLQRKKQTQYMAWYNSLKEKAKIKDDRDQYYN